MERAACCQLRKRQPSKSMALFMVKTALFMTNCMVKNVDHRTFLGRHQRQRWPSFSFLSGQRLTSILQPFSSRPIFPCPFSQFRFFYFQQNGQAMKTCTSNPWTQTSARDPPSGPQGLALAPTPTTRTLSPSTLTQTPWKRGNSSNNQRKKKPR